MGAGAEPGAEGDARLRSQGLRSQGLRSQARSRSRSRGHGPDAGPGGSRRKTGAHRPIPHERESRPKLGLKNSEIDTPMRLVLT